MDVKLRLKYLLERMIQTPLGFFRVFPIRPGRILFSAFSGRQYSDSPRRISEALLETHPEYEQIWAFTEPEKFRFLEEKGIRVIKFKSLDYLYYALTSNVFVDNVEFWSILKFRPGQMILQTWHGGGCYKRVGSDRLDVSDLELQHVIRKMEQNTLFVSSCKEFTRNVIRGAFGYRGEVLEVGLPRNDELLRGNGADLGELRRQLGIPEGNRVVLYAPTFRKSLKTDLYDVDMERLRSALSRRFGGEWTVVLRLHYYMAEQILSAAQGENVVDATAYPDMQDLLRLADVLVTDYSSSLWDFSLMNKPAFVYANDLADYCTERNFYMPIDRWPFPKAVGNDSLEQEILGFREDEYRRAVAEHHAALGSTETGNATGLVCERIDKHIKESSK